MALERRSKSNIWPQQTVEVLQPTDSAPSVSGRRRGREGQKRPKYTARACVECQRRKVKCSGEDTCYHCRTRDEQCVYTAKPQDSRRSPKRRAVAEPTNDIDVYERPSRRNDSQDSDANPRVEVHSTNHRKSLRLETGPEGHENDSLAERVRFLEKMMQMVASSNSHAVTEKLQEVTTDDERLHPDKSQLPPDLNEEYQDLFSPSVTRPDDLTVASQLAELRNALGMSPTTVPFLPDHSPHKGGVALIIPRPPKLRHLLNVYFHDLHCYFPFVDRQETEGRIFETLEYLKWGNENQKVLVDLPNLSVMCLLCNMLAMAECLDSANGICDDAKPGWFMYHQGQKAAQTFICSRFIDLDVVRYRILSVAYLLHSELLRLASQAVAIAYQSATAIKLHEQAAWSNCSAEEVASRRRMWWTLYFLDRRIAQKSGLAYQIRESDFVVEEFSNKPEAKRPSQQGITLGAEDANNGLELTGTSSAADHSYLQALIDIGKLWGYMWDNFFAASARRLADWGEIELMDTRILNVKRRLPSCLAWEDDDKIAEYIEVGESEPQLRRRLQVYTRLNLFRMLIRQSPLHPTPPDSDTIRFCGQLACNTVATHASYVAYFPEARSSGYFATVSMVECVYHLAPLLRNPGFLEEHATAVSSLRSACQVVAQLAPRLNVAKRALRALQWISSQCDAAEPEHAGSICEGEQALHEPQECISQAACGNADQCTNESGVTLNNDMPQNAPIAPLGSINSPQNPFSAAEFDMATTPFLGDTYFDLNHLRPGINWDGLNPWDLQTG